MKKLLLTFLLVGCQSNNIHQSNVPIQPQEPTEEIRKKVVVSFEEKVNKLNDAGKGSLKVCNIENHRSSINVFYSNELGKRLVFRVYDEHIVNSVSMYLDKKQTSDFIDYIQKSTIKAKENKELQKLNLGRFKSGKNWVMLTSRKGMLSGFWGTEWVDRVLTPINSEKITECSEKVQAYL